MSARTTSSRGDGFNFPAFFPAGTVGPVFLPADARLHTIQVKAGAVPTTINVLVNGVSVLAQTTRPSGTVAANENYGFNLSAAAILLQGSSIQVTSTDATALISLAFRRA